MADDRVRGNDAGSDSADGVAVPAAVVVQDATRIDLVLPASAVDHKDLFTSRSTVVTSNVLTLLAYTLNWYAHIHGQPEYMPDWVIGFIWAGFGMDVWRWVKTLPTKR